MRRGGVSGHGPFRAHVCSEPFARSAGMIGISTIGSTVGSKKLVWGAAEPVAMDIIRMTDSNKSGQLDG